MVARKNPLRYLETGEPNYAIEWEELEEPAMPAPVLNPLRPEDRLALGLTPEPLYDEENENRSGRIVGAERVLSRLLR